MPEYAVRNTETGDVRIVIAARPETALAHVTTPLFAVTKATAQDGIDACMQGRRIEVAGEEPATVSGHEPPPEYGGVSDATIAYAEQTRAAASLRPDIIPGTDLDSSHIGSTPPRVDGDPADAPQFDTTDQQEPEDR